MNRQICFLLGILISSSFAQEPVGTTDILEKHRAGSEKIADRQDELSADVQQLIIEQTIPEVIELFNEVERIMDETTDRLAETHTDGKTIAAQTEIIEKINAAAKERQKQMGSGKSGGAMMDMMERMMGKEPGGKKEGTEKEGEAGEEGGKGQTGESDAENDGDLAAGEANVEERRVPKASGNAGTAIPAEFRKALDAYNRGAEQKIKK